MVHTVGYPAESPEAGGQRPRLPFEERYYLNRYAQAFPRDAEVVEGLKGDKMIQQPAPLSWRWAELEYLARALDIPAIFGEEVEGITREMVKEMSETSGES